MGWLLLPLNFLTFLDLSTDLDGFFSSILGFGFTSEKEFSIHESNSSNDSYKLIPLELTVFGFDILRTSSKMRNVSLYFYIAIDTQLDCGKLVNK